MQLPIFDHVNLHKQKCHAFKKNINNSCLGITAVNPYVMFMAGQVCLLKMVRVYQFSSHPGNQKFQSIHVSLKSVLA